MKTAAGRACDYVNVNDRKQINSDVARSRRAEQTGAAKWRHLQPKRLEVFVAVCVRSLVVLLRRRHAGEHVGHQRAGGGGGVEVLR